MTQRTGLVSAVLLVAAIVGDVRAVPADDAAYEKGQYVVVNEQAPLKDRDRIVATVPVGRVLRVREVKGNWLLVAVEDGKPIKGWIHSKYVVSISVTLERLREHARNAPDDANNWREIGWALLLSNDYDAALDAYDQAIQKNPRLAIAYAGRAYIHWVQGAHVSAVMDMAKARRLEAKLPEAQRTVAGVEEPIQAGDEVVTLDDTPLKKGERTLLTIPAGTLLYVANVRDNWINVTVEDEDQTVSGWLSLKKVTRHGHRPCGRRGRLPAAAGQRLLVCRVRPGARDAPCLRRRRSAERAGVRLPRPAGASAAGGQVGLRGH